MQFHYFYYLNNDHMTSVFYDFTTHFNHSVIVLIISDSFICYIVINQLEFP